jgi:hypothetical protein
MGDLIRLDCETVTETSSRACYASTDEVVLNTHAFQVMTVAFGLLLGANGRAQSAEIAVAAADNTRVQSVARLVDGRWVSAAPCTTSDSSSTVGGRERLIASGGLVAQNVRAVGSGTPEWLRLAPAIGQAFERREREARLTTDRTSRAPRAIDWIYALDDSAGRVYYFEASRRVPNASDDVDADTDPPGTIRIAVAGFLRDGRDGPVSIGTKSELRWEQDGRPAGPGRPDLTPLGTVTHGGRSVWVMKGQSGPSSWFTLYEVGDATRTVLTARVTSC